MVFNIPKLKPSKMLQRYSVLGATCCEHEQTKWNYFWCIFNYAIGKPFSAFCEGCSNVTFPSLSIEPKIKTCDLMPAIFFSGKLHTPITCFPNKFSSL